MVAVALFVVLRLAVVGPNPSAFVVATTNWVDVDRVPDSLVVDPTTTGYDGLFFYRLALDPATDVRTDFGVTLDIPAYRQARIVYPSVAHVLALGSPDFVPTTLILVNVLAMGLLSWALGQLARDAGRAPLAGAMLALVPGLVFSVSRDLSEPLALALAACAILAASRSRWVLCAALFTGAVLTRETTAIWALGVSLAAAMQMREKVPWRRAAAGVMAGGVPLVILLGWQFVVGSIWGETPFAGGQQNLVAPFVGIVESVHEDLAVLAAGLSGQELLDVTLAALVGGFLVLTALALVRSRAPLSIKCGLVLGSILFVCEGSAVWEAWAGFTRTGSDLVVFGGLVVALSPSLALRRLAWLWPMSSLPVAAYLVVRL